MDNIISNAISQATTQALRSAIIIVRNSKDTTEAADRLQAVITLIENEKKED